MAILDFASQILLTSGMAMLQDKYLWDITTTPEVIVELKSHNDRIRALVRSNIDSSRPLLI